MLLTANSGMHGPRRGLPRYDMVNDSVDFFADLGFDALDISFTSCIYEGTIHEPILDAEDPTPALDRLIEKCRERGLAMPVTHLPYRFNYLNPEEPVYAENYAMTVKALKASEYIGAEWAVMHIRSVEGTVAYVKRLFADSGITKTGIAIENDPTLSIDILIAAHDILKAEGYNVGICFDIGHGNVKSYIQYDVVELIKLLGERIKVLHIHDNCGNYDAHKAPFAGNIPWERVMAALKSVGFVGEFNYEIITSDMPDCLRLKFAEYYRDIGRYLIDVFERCNRE